ncbi:hypothetical protein CDAR_270691 [Caerostris darwini]|uniref:Uncharacterized protein n=1 Tax=Caerostris darwini TaxID=1538125 RepID=A0AAV4THU5_9ARAC|nr:hypothetical protein CDAR_270691 [Caerostris darwini]
MDFWHAEACRQMCRLSPDVPQDKPAPQECGIFSSSNHLSHNWCTVTRVGCCPLRYYRSANLLFSVQPLLNSFVGNIAVDEAILQFVCLLNRATRRSPKSDSLYYPHPAQNNCAFRIIYITR